MDKISKSEIRSNPSAEELRASLVAGEGADVRNQLASLFDSSTFVETSAYTKRAFSEFLATEKTNEFEGVICGYGAIDGKLVFAFAEDASRMGGAMDERHAKKITDLYDMAIRNSAPIVGIFNSNGADIFTGTASLAAYARIMKAVNKASGVVPQYAYVAGKCIGTAAAIAAMFDFVVKETKADFYVSSPALTGVKDAQNSSVSFVGDEAQCFGMLRSLISFLPSSAQEGFDVTECSDNLNRMLGDLDFGGEALSVIASISDNGVFYELGSNFVPGVSTVLAVLGGVKCGIVGTSFAKDEGKITADAAKKISRFVNFCDCFSLPLVTIVDSLGLSQDEKNECGFADALADLAFAYASSSMPKITVICGHAIGAAFPLLGSKALGADVVYATDSSEIGALSADSGVAFAWDKYITEENKRSDLIAEWKATVSSPVSAASSGEIDDIIGVSELRARICSALLMLSANGNYRNVLPL